MKQLKVLSILAIIVIFISACKSTPHDKINGKWNVTKIENSTMTDQEDIDFFNQMNADLINNEELKFTDGKITKTFPEIKEGKWEMNETGTQLMIDWGEDDTYSPHNFVIKSLSDDSMVIEEDYDEFFITTTLKKIK